LRFVQATSWRILVTLLPHYETEATSFGPGRRYFA
jgi:hypothetical protein